MFDARGLDVRLEPLANLSHIGVNQCALEGGRHVVGLQGKDPRDVLSSTRPP